VTGADTKEKFWSGNDIREAFLRFFESKEHRRVRSSSLVPHGDATLLFTNAGMNQFKDVFLGLEKREYTRATTAQKCVRAGGKHNDLENVGFTKRHHTFFEMLGNFSFGDYFKKDAIAFAWELITSPQWFGISKDKLYVTVFTRSEISPGQVCEEDHESLGYWSNRDTGLPASRIFPLGAETNFWAMGDTGPCGPCSEIHYDMGPEASELGHKDCAFPCDCGRYVEIWNLVFMEFNRDASGTLTRLPKPCVDTGMGLERVAAVLQGVISNYETDLFVPLMKRAAELCGVDYEEEVIAEAGKGGAASLRVVADHARATTFLIADGVFPSNEGRGYVLRKIMRRAILHSQMLSDRQGTLGQMVPEVVNLMKEAYPELVDDERRITDIVRNEERRFGRTLAVGLRKFETDLQEIGLQRELDKAVTSRPESFGLREKVLSVDKSRAEAVYPGEWAFRLYDTYGLPLDFIRDVVRDARLELDEAGFDRAMQEQRTKARASWKGGAKEAANPAYAKLAEKTAKTEPDFYSGTTAKDCRIEAIITKGNTVGELKPGQSGEIILNRTAIYAESGGQVADTGWFYDNSESQLLADVTGAFYRLAGFVSHNVVARETLHLHDRISVVADAERRARIIRNHTGTHLVNAALRNILGTHVKQSGSLNAPERLRFDFTHFAHVDAEELRDIEQQVNDEIRLNTEIETNVTSLEEALASGALAFFGDKYPEHNVRVVTIPDPRAARGFYSKELCGGTHVQRVGDIGVLKIVSEESVAAGVRRIEAVTGIGAVEHYQQQAQVLRQLASQLNVGEDGILAQVEKLAQTAKQLEKDIREARKKIALEAMTKGKAEVRLVKNTKLVVSQVEDVDREQLREILDRLRQEIGSGVIVLASTENGNIALIVGVTKDLTAKVHAGKLIQVLAKQVGGSGGGRPDLAEAGGKDTAALKSALLSIPSLLEALL